MATRRRRRRQGGRGLKVGVKLGRDKHYKNGCDRSRRTLQRKSKTVGSMKKIKHNFPFIKSIFRQASRYKRQEILRHANSDQINAVSDVKEKNPVKPPLMAQLRQHKNILI